MGWKNWPSWLKGGLIGIVVAILFLIIPYITNCSTSFGGVGGSCDNNIKLFFAVVNFILIIPALSLTQNMVLITILTLILLFLIGAFIGWIISKIKSKSKRKRR